MGTIFRVGIIIVVAIATLPNSSNAFLKAAIGLRIGLSPTEKGYGQNPHHSSGLYGKGPAAKAQFLTGVHGKPGHGQGHHGHHGGGGYGSGLLKHLKILGVNLYLGGPKHGHHQHHHGGHNHHGGWGKQHGHHHHTGHNPSNQDHFVIDGQNEIPGSGHASSSTMVGKVYGNGQGSSYNYPIGSSSQYPTTTMNEVHPGQRPQLNGPYRYPNYSHPSSGPRPPMSGGGGFSLSSLMRGPQWSKNRSKFRLHLLPFVGRRPPPPPPRPQSQSPQQQQPTTAHKFSTLYHLNMGKTPFPFAQQSAYPQYSHQTHYSGRQIDGHGHGHHGVVGQFTQQPVPILPDSFTQKNTGHFASPSQNTPTGPNSEGSHPFAQPPPPPQEQSPPINQFPQGQFPTSTQNTPTGPNSEGSHPFGPPPPPPQQQFTQQANSYYNSLNYPTPAFSPMPNDVALYFNNGQHGQSSHPPSSSPQHFNIPFESSSQSQQNPFGSETQNPFASERQQQQQFSNNPPPPPHHENSPQQQQQQQQSNPQTHPNNNFFNEAVQMPYQQPPHHHHHHHPQQEQGFQYSHTVSSPVQSMGMTSYDDPPIMGDYPDGQPTPTNKKTKRNNDHQMKQTQIQPSVSSSRLVKSMTSWNPLVDSWSGASAYSVSTVVPVGNGSGGGFLTEKKKKTEKKTRLSSGGGGGSGESDESSKPSSSSAERRRFMRRKVTTTTAAATTTTTTTSFNTKTTTQKPSTTTTTTSKKTNSNKSSEVKN